MCEDGELSLSVVPQVSLLQKRGYSKLIDINWTLAAQILNFLILVVLLRAFAYKPIVNMLQERRAKIEMSLAKADEDVEKAAALKKEYEDQLASARVKAQNIIDSAARQASEERDESVVKTKREIEQMKKSAAEEIERERRAAAETLRAEVVALSMAAASKVIAKNLDEKANESLIVEFAERLGNEKLGDLSC